jgi:hypothetical protein
MRLALSTLAPVIALTALVSGCAITTTYETGLNVCSSGNGTVKSATVTKSSGDAAADKYAVEQVAMAAVYEPSERLVCRPLTVEHRVAGSHQKS